MASALGPIAPSLEEQLHAAAHIFRRRFGIPPRLGAQAPGRVNLIGEHTDYNDGFVLPIAIDRRTVMVAAPAGAAHSTFLAPDLDVEAEADLTRPITPVDRALPGGFANYVLGVAQQFIERGLRLPNLDVVITSSVPIGAGLSSSASVEVAMATLLEQVTGEALSEMEKVRLCQRAEHAFPGTPCGIMDQMISTCGRRGHALLIDCRDHEARLVPAPPPERVSILVADTGVKHALASSEYGERRDTCASAARTLGLESLREATLAMLEGAALTDVERRRASHVITENTRTLLAATALCRNDLDTLGGLLYAGHDSLRDLYGVSCPELDLLVDSARALGRSGGVWGGRMTGGGFGGCAIVICAADAIESVAETLASDFADRFGRRPNLFPAIASDGASPVEPAA